MFNQAAVTVQIVVIQVNRLSTREFSLPLVYFHIKGYESKNETNLGVSTGLFMHTKLLFNVVPITDHASFK